MPADRLVLVTGASGFIASHVIRELLERGYRVRGTVRSLARRDSYAHVSALPGADRLELVEADLMDSASFVAAVRGVTDVLHVASPYIVQVDDPQRDLVDPAVNGTRAVLTACAQEAGVRRVVITSSVAAITDEPESDHMLTEADWNTKSTLTRNPYYYSKTLAERAAWEFMSEPRAFDLVVVNPFLVIGPALGPGVNASNEILVSLTTGTYPAVLALTFGTVDVRDVALAHVAAMETPGAHGRYICAGEVVPMRTLIATMRSALPASVKLPTRSMDGAVGTAVIKLASYFQPGGVGSYLRTHLGRVPRYDTTKIRTELGVSFRPADESIRDTVADLVAAGHITVPPTA